MKKILVIIMLAFSVSAVAANYKEAYFAGGCFWCLEKEFEGVRGVQEVVSGYAGGRKENPTYQEVSDGGTGHRETVRVTYDADLVSYDELLDVFWRLINPTDEGGQFVDRGYQYTTAIFYESEEDGKKALASKEKYEKMGVFGGPIVTDIAEFTTFYRAEEYHQNYYKKKKVRYHYYRSHSGRDEYLKKIWG